MFRILVVTNGWGVRTIGGGEYHILRVLQRWSRECKISIIMPRSGYVSSRKMLSKDHPIYFSSLEKEVTSVIREATLYPLRVLRSSFFRFKDYPNIIIASSHLLYDVLPSLILRIRSKSKLVIYVHGIFLRDDAKGILRAIATWSEKISLFLCKKADLIFVVNPDIKDTLVARGYRPDKIIVTGNGVERDLINSIKVDEKKFDGCFCGRIVEKKGVYDLLDIWEKVLKKFPQSRLVIIGDGSDYSKVAENVKNKGLDKSITLTGFVSETDKISLIKSSRIFISPSHEESWGIAVSEALACGLAVICYDLTAYNIFGDCITKIGVGNKEGMANAITCLLADKNEQEAFAVNAKEVTSNLLDWDNISIKEIKEIYKKSNQIQSSGV
jgi:glycosyltransferase involved in cell wall biosynthesis